MKIFKNSNGKVYMTSDGKALSDTASGEQSFLINTTYDELKNLRELGELVPGQQYRITDYECHVNQANEPEAQVVSHPFDIIVVADNERTLNKNARACLRDGDTYYSANDCKADLSAWELKYCLDNDTERFAWADSENGKGVIFWLKDDWNNECPYDFKQIQFKRYKITECDKAPDLVGLLAAKEHSNYIKIDKDSFIWCYTFSWLSNDGTVEDLSVKQYSHSDDEGMSQHCYDNKIQVYSKGDYEDGNNLYKIFLNNISIIDTEEYDVGNYYGCYSNTFGNNCYSNTFGSDCNSNTFGNNCYSNTFGIRTSSSTTTANNYYRYNIFGNGSSYISLTANNVGALNNFCQNYHILSGFNNNQNTTINATRNLSYCTYVGKTSTGEIKTWNPADLV